MNGMMWARSASYGAAAVEAKAKLEREVSELKRHLKAERTSNSEYAAATTAASETAVVAIALAVFVL